MRPGRRGLCLQMDAGGRPAAEGWRRMEAPPEGADLVPLDRYDAARAKIAANLQWICAKAYGLGGRARRGPGQGGWDYWGTNGERIGLRVGTRGEPTGHGLLSGATERCRTGAGAGGWDQRETNRGRTGYGTRGGRNSHRMGPEGDRQGIDWTRYDTEGTERGLTCRGMRPERIGRWTNRAIGPEGIR